MVAEGPRCSGLHPPREGLVVAVEDLSGEVGGGDDDGVDAAELEVHEGAVDFGEIAEGLVGFGPELVDVSDDRERAWAQRGLG